MESLEMDPNIFMVMCSWVSHEFVLCLLHTCSPLQVFTLTGRPLASESCYPKSLELLWTCTSQLQIPSEWEIRSKTNLQKALFFSEKIFLTLRILALPQGVLINLSQKPNDRHLAMEFWTPTFLKDRKGIQYLNKKCTMNFHSHIGKIMYQISHYYGDTNASRCLLL